MTLWGITWLPPREHLVKCRSEVALRVFLETVVTHRALSGAFFGRLQPFLRRSLSDLRRRVTALTRAVNAPLFLFPSPPISRRASR